jgi:hypothetical protein
MIGVLIGVYACARLITAAAMVPGDPTAREHRRRVTLVVLVTFPAALAVGYLTFQLSQAGTRTPDPESRLPTRHPVEPVPPPLTR